MLKEIYVFADEASSPDSERFHSTDVDSGNSTAHSPDGPKSMSPQLGHQGEFHRLQVRALLKRAVEREYYVLNLES
jgi:hypothetical protein